MIHSANEENNLEEEYSETFVSLTGSTFPTFCTMPDRERQLYATDNPVSGGFLVDGESSFHHHQQGDFSSAVSSITFDDSFTTSATSSRLGGGKAFPTLAEDEELHMTHDNNSSLGGTTISSRFIPGTTTRRKGRRYSMPDQSSLIKGGDLLGDSNHRFHATGAISNSLASSHHSSVPSASHELCQPPRRRPSANSIMSGATTGTLSSMNNSFISDATSGYTSFNEDMTISTIETDLLDEDVSYLIASPSKSSRSGISLGSHGGSAICNSKYGRRASTNSIGCNLMYPRRLSPTLEADEPTADRADEETTDTHLGSTLHSANTRRRKENQDDAEEVTPSIRIPCRSRSPVPNAKRRQSITLEAATAPFGACANHWAVQSDITLESFLFEDSSFLARDFEDACAVDRHWGVGSSLTMTSLLEDYSSPNITSRRTSFNKGNKVNSGGGKDINGNHSSLLGGTTAPATTVPAEDRVVSSRFANTCRALSPCSKPERSESQGTNSSGPLRGTLCGVPTKDGLVGSPATTTGVVLKSKPPLVQPESSRTLASQESQQSAPSMPTRRASVESNFSISSSISLSS